MYVHRNIAKYLWNAYTAFSLFFLYLFNNANYMYISYILKNRNIFNLVILNVKKINTATLWVFKTNNLGNTN